MQQRMKANTVNSTPDLPQLVTIALPEIADGLDALRRQPPSHIAPYATNGLCWQMGDGLGQRRGGQKRQTIRLLHVRGQLGEQDIAGDADGAGHADADLVADALLDALGQRGGGHWVFLIAVEAAGDFVDRQGVGNRDAVVDGGEDTVMIGDIKFMARHDDAETGAKPLGLVNRCASLDATGFGGIAGGNGASAVGEHRGNRDGQAAQTRVFLLLAGGEKTIEVQHQPTQAGRAACQDVHVLF